MNRVVSFVAAIAAAATAALSAQVSVAQVAFPVERPVVKVGDRWKYRMLDGYTKAPTGESIATVIAATADSFDLRQSDNKGNVQTDSYDLAWARLVYVRGKTERQYPYAFPLTDGKTWTSNWNWINDRGRFGELEMTYKIKGTERITTPAGTFDTVLIEGKGVWKNVTVSSSGPALETSWYSPQAKRYVRRTWITRYFSGGTDQNFTTELVEVEVQP